LMYGLTQFEFMSIPASDTRQLRGMLFAQAFISPLQLP
jgi:hypothetical protein